MGDYICFTWFLLKKSILADTHFFVVCQEDYLIIIYKLLNYLFKEESVYIFTVFWELKLPQLLSLSFPLSSPFKNGCVPTLLHSSLSIKLYVKSSWVFLPVCLTECRFCTSLLWLVEAFPSNFQAGFISGQFTPTFSFARSVLQLQQFFPPPCCLSPRRYLQFHPFQTSFC